MEHSIVYAGPTFGGLEIVCRCGVQKSAAGSMILPSYGGLLAQHMAEAKQRQIDYEDGRWCGECRYGVVEDPPCCTHQAVSDV